MTKVVLNDVRVSYMYLYGPPLRDADGEIRKDEDDETMFEWGKPKKDKKGNYEKPQMQVIVRKDHPLLGEFNDEVDRILDVKYQGIKRAKLKLPLNDGDELSDKAEHVDCYYFSVKAYRRYKMVNRFGKKMTEAEFDELCYSGCKLTVSLGLFAFESDEGKDGIAVAINNIMLRENSDKPDSMTPRLDGSTEPNEDFDGMADSPDDAQDEFVNAEQELLDDEL